MVVMLVVVRGDGGDGGGGDASDGGGRACGGRLSMVAVVVGSGHVGGDGGGGDGGDGSRRQYVAFMRPPLAFWQQAEVGGIYLPAPCFLAAGPSPFLVKQGSGNTAWCHSGGVGDDGEWWW